MEMKPPLPIRSTHSPELHIQPLCQRFEHFLMRDVDFFGPELAGGFAVYATDQLLISASSGDPAKQSRRYWQTDTFVEEEALQATINQRFFASPKLHPEPLRQRFEHFLVGGVDLFGFERAGGFAVVEAVGDGLAVGGDLLAGGVGEDVEALG